MPKKLTREEFIERARAVHGDKYNYDKVVYVNSSTDVVITCPMHGDFPQNPHNHIGLKHDCPKCRYNKQRTKIYGVGINDSGDVVHGTKCYDIWTKMLRRCYEIGNTDKTYKGCFICKDWLSFSNFKQWYDENYIQGYEIDKDLLGYGQQIYSPETCCFIPKEINVLIKPSISHNPSLGVYLSKHTGLYRAQTTLGGKPIRGRWRMSKSEARQDYKHTKESYVKEIAVKYYSDGKIAKRVYDALMRYEVEIAD